MRKSEILGKGPSKKKGATYRILVRAKKIFHAAYLIPFSEVGSPKRPESPWT